MKNPLQTSNLWHDPAPQSVEAAILCTLAYADLFNYPLTAREVQRFLVGMEVDVPTVDGLLSNGHAPKHVVRHGEYFALSSREWIIGLRRRRALAAEKLWPDAIRYGRAIARLPFVRMTAVTGALAVDNADADDDIDYLVVTAPDRLWLCRAMIIQFVVKPAARRRITLCPNFLITERALSHFEPNLFTAHEIVQMVPVAGRETYQRMCLLNQWAARFLPNAYGRPRSVTEDAAPVASPPPLGSESILRSPIGGGLERWEMRRKIRRFGRGSPGDTEASFTADWCKGHFENHSRFVRDNLFRRLASLGDQGRRDAA